MITLQEMADLARALLDAVASVDEIESNLKAAREAARVLREETIPAAMQEMGIEELKLDTGQTLSVKQDVYAAIPAESKGEAFAWLNEHGFGGLIKTEVTCNFGKGERDAAAKLLERLLAERIAATFDENVHPQTLKAFLREQVAKGSSIPLELFGARPVWTASIKKGK